MNLVELTGRLTKDVEVRYTQNGGAVTSFTVACDRKVKRGDAWESQPDFIRCVAFGKTAEFIEKYFHKGSFIVVSGSIKTGSYDDNDGKKVYTTDVLVDKAEFGGSKADDSNNGSRANADGFMNIPDGIDEEVPFN